MASCIEFSPETIQEHLNGLQASADLIAKLIADDEKIEETLATMDRNIRHLEIMMAMDHIKNSNTNLAPFIAAKDSGKAWMVS